MTQAGADQGVAMQLYRFDETTGRGGVMYLYVSEPDTCSAEEQACAAGG